MEQLVIAFFLALVAKTIIDAIIAPIVAKWPKIDWWWLRYPAWVLGGLLAWIAGVNLFAAYLPNAELAARILTAIVVGGGSHIIADLFGSATDKKLKYADNNYGEGADKPGRELLKLPADGGS